jgi:sterol desaturase/sphingolipid hydroxylase (fatty acid hydroxylase superfamily)
MSLSASLPIDAYGLFQQAVKPLAVIGSPRSRMYWVYLLVSLLPVVIAYAVEARRRHRFRFSTAWRRCFPKRMFLHPSARVDYLFFFVNALAMTLFLGALTLGKYEVFHASSSTFASWVGPQTPMPRPHLFASLVVTLATALAMDFGLFIAHYLQHRIPLLWEFHKVHHSAAVLNPITVYRMHPVDDIVVGLTAGVLGGVTPAFFAHFVFPGVQESSIAGLNPVFLLFYLSFYHLRHSHFWLPYPPWVSRWLISPAQHQIHHSKNPIHFDKNMGFIFAFWDRMFGTLYVPYGRERLKLGLSHDEEREFSSVTRLYLLPFRNALRVVGRRLARRDRISLSAPDTGGTLGQVLPGSPHEMPADGR